MNPLLDVTLPITDPDFASSFSVIRRIETVGTNGRNSFTPTTFSGVIGVVTAASGNDLDRREAFQVAGRAISVVTKFELQGEATGIQPDLIYWRGSYYLVKLVDPYGHFGPGFYEALCESTNYTDPAIFSGYPGLAAGTIVPGSMLNFNVQQTVLLGAICC